MGKDKGKARADTPPGERMPRRARMGTGQAEPTDFAQAAFASENEEEGEAARGRAGGGEEEEEWSGEGRVVGAAGAGNDDGDGEEEDASTWTDRDLWERERALFQTIGGAEDLLAESSRRGAGRIRFDDNGAMWFSWHEGLVGQRATFHHWVRDEIAAVENAKGRYKSHEDCTRDAGTGPGDETCYCIQQYGWGKTRDHYPPVILRYEKQGLENPYVLMHDMKFRGLLVISRRMRPVRVHPILPWVLSSAYEGIYMEAAMRTDSRIDIADITDRMPPIRQVYVRGKKLVINYPLFVNGAFSNRMRHFRNRAGCVAWVKTDKKVKAYLDARLDRVAPSARAANDMSAALDLTDEEIEEMLALNVGSRPEKARFSSSTKQRYLVNQGIVQGSTQPSLGAGQGSGQPSGGAGEEETEERGEKRKRDDEEEDEEEEEEDE